MKENGIRGYSWTLKGFILIWVMSMLVSGCNFPVLAPEGTEIEGAVPLETVDGEVPPELTQDVNPEESEIVEETVMPEETKVSGTGVLESQVQRELDPQVSDIDLADVVAGNNAFAIDFYRQASQEDGNLFFSPYSLSIALAMTYAGARGETEQQMVQALHFSLPQETIHQAFNALDLDLSSRASDVEDMADAQAFQLNIANALWGQSGYPFLGSFVDQLALNYGAGLRLVDFAQAAEEARLEINQWVEDQTQGKIKDLIPEGIPLEMTRLVLTNAIYFKADWQFPFMKEATSEQPFYLLDGEQTQVEMMAQSDPKPLPYLAGDGFQALEFPYVGDEVAMLLLVPDAGQFVEFEKSFDSERLDEIVGQLKEERVSLYMPKFSFTKEITANDVLDALGMKDAFQPGTADFSGMDGARDLFIQYVLHKAFVAVDEKGTEAAAATAVIVGKTAIMEPDVRLVIDRPFIFLIRDKVNGSILFVGRYEGVK